MNTSANAIANLISKSRFRKPSLQLNRRRAKRHRIDVPARFRIYLPSHPEMAGTYLPAQVFDLSKLGIGLLAESVECEGLHIMHPWPAASEQCVLEIKVLCDEAPLTLQGRAVWYSQQEEEQPFGFRIGIEFQDLTAEQKTRIRDLIHQKTSTKDVSPPPEPEDSL
jgi:hypothetical protein